MVALKVLDRGSDGSLELDDGLACIRDLVVDNDLKIHAVVVHHALDGAEVDPKAGEAHTLATTTHATGVVQAHLFVLKI